MMTKQNYVELLKSPKWQKKRLEIMKRDKFKCRLCGDKETQLHIHHKEYISSNDPWDYDNKLLITLCEDCHTEVERLKKENPEIVFDEIKVYKSNNWQGGSKIIFTSIPNNCSMTVYDGDNKWICGYNLCQDIPSIIKILKQAQNG